MRTGIIWLIHVFIMRKTNLTVFKLDINNITYLIIIVMTKDFDIITPINSNSLQSIIMQWYLN